MKAMDAMLQVPPKSGADIGEILQKKDKNAFVVFYAPWCPHCQRFVLHDGKGDPTKAPLEVFRRELAQDAATKDVKVVRFDVQRDRNIPKDFEVQYIPTVYFVAAGTGAVKKFEE